MAITYDSGTKFFSDSRCLLQNGASISVSSGEALKANMLNFDKAFIWSSIGSDDATLETIIITLNDASRVNRIYARGVNWKAYSITYNGGTEFTNVYTIDEQDNPSSGINESANLKAVVYYEFDAVEVETIEINITTTQVLDQEKTCSTFFCAEEIGTFSNSGLAKVNATISQNSSVQRNLINKAFVQKGVETFSASISSPYVATQEDSDLYETLREMQQSFIVWVCGGHYGAGKYSLEKKPYRLEDLYRVQVIGDSNPSFYSDCYLLGTRDSISITEVA